MSFEYWVDVVQQHRVDMYAAAQRVLGDEQGTGWAEVHDDDQPPVTQVVTVSLMVGIDAIDAVRLFEKLADYNADQVTSKGGHIRLRAVSQDVDIVMAVR